jgi:hypothetical protein
METGRMSEGSRPSLLFSAKSGNPEGWPEGWNDLVAFYPIPVGKASFGRRFFGKIWLAFQPLS